MRTAAFFLVGVFFCSFSCNEESENSNTGSTDDAQVAYEVCDPLAVEADPVELRSVIAVGKDASGRLYAIDGGGVDVRAYLSKGDALERAYVLGAGQGGDTYLLSLKTQEGEELTLAAEVGEVIRMAVCPGQEERSFEEIVAHGEELEVLDPSTVAEMPLTNLPTNVQIEFLAQIESGDFIIVFLPNLDSSYEDYRLFIGPEELLEEKTITDVTWGGSTEFFYKTADDSAVLSFPEHFTDEGTVWDPATLKIGEETLQVERLDSSTYGDYSFVFNCFS